MSVKEKKVSEQYAPVSPLYQIIFIGISALVIVFCLYRNLNNLHIIDKQPTIEYVTPQTLNEFGEFPSLITVGLHIDKFETFDMVKNQFLVDCIIWFKYIAGSISLKTLEHFSFSQSEIIEKSTPEVYIDDEYIIARYSIKLKFSSNINYTFFPVDNHRIYLTLVHGFISPKEVQFEGGEELFTIAPNALESGWDIIDKNAITGYDQAQFNDDDEPSSIQEKTYPIAIFSFDIKRDGMRHLMTILLPLLLIFYISFFGLSIRDGSLGLGIMGISAIITYRFVIQNMSPDTLYFMISDYIFFLFLIAELLVFLLIIVKLYTNILQTFQTKIVIAVIHILSLSVSSYILLGMSI